MILKYLKHENIMGLKDAIYVESEPVGDIYLVSQIMQTDLHRVIKTGIELTDDHIQYIIYQLCKSLRFIHSANIIHRDIKPSNILIN